MSTETRGLEATHRVICKKIIKQIQSLEMCR